MTQHQQIPWLFQGLAPTFGLSDHWYKGHPQWTPDFSLTLDLDRNIAHTGHPLDSLLSQQPMAAPGRLVNLLSTLKGHSPNFWPIDAITSTVLPHQDAQHVIGANDVLQLWTKLPLSQERVLPSALYLLRQFGSRIGCGRSDLPGISLYEYNRLRFALDCARSTNTYPYLLVCLDLSGIQSFLYNIGGQGAAASLKGRSFFLHLAMDALVRSILEKFHLSSAQVLYSGGGKAFLLLPNEEAGTKKLSKLVEHANTSAFKNHQGQLQFHFGAVAFRIAQFGSLELEGVQSPVPYSQLWGAAVQNASANKGRKLAHLIQQQPSLLFGDDFNGLDIDDNHAFCRVTGRTLLKGEAIAKLQKEDYSGDKPLVTREVKDMIDLGKALRNVRYIGIRKHLGDGAVSTTKVPFELGFYYEPLEEAPAPEDGFDTVIHFNESETPLGPFVPEWMPLGGTEMVWEQSENRQKTLKELCKGSYLGGLRMDVDNLGRLFSQTTNDLGNSLFGLTTVSASINWFFSAHINALRRNEPFKDRVNVIYAGGDDLFMVGEWEAVLQFGKAIRNAFQTFLGGTTMTLSGGLAISGAKYPLRLLALDSGDAEDNAKAFCRAGSKENNDPTKNALGIFNGAYAWDEEWPEVEILTREMFQLIKNRNLPRGFLHRAIDWKRNKDEYLKAQATTAPRFMWDLAYLLGRNEQGAGREWGVQLRKNIALGHVFTPNLKSIQGAYRYLDVLATSARLTELKTKTKKSDGTNKT